jgi:hypothetical protein
MISPVVNIGWFRFTTRGLDHISDICKMLDLPPPSWQQTKGQLFLGYYPMRSVYQFDGYSVSLYSNGHHTMFDVPQTHCEALGTERIRTIGWYAHTYASATFGRTDLYIDVDKSLVSVNKVIKEVKRSNIVTRFRGDNIKFHADKNNVTGVTFGKRSGSKYLRVYDKKLEQMSKGRVIDDDITRFELELKLEHSNAFMLEWCSDSDNRPETNDFIRSAILSSIDFRVNDSKKRVNKWKRCDWFAKIIDNVTKWQSNIIKPIIGQTFERAQRYISNAMPTLAALTARLGVKWLQDQLTLAPNRWNDNHRIVAHSLTRAFSPTFKGVDTMFDGRRIAEQVLNGYDQKIRMKLIKIHSLHVSNPIFNKRSDQMTHLSFCFTL